MSSNGTQEVNGILKVKILGSVRDLENLRTYFKLFNMQITSPRPAIEPPSNLSAIDNVLLTSILYCQDVIMPRPIGSYWSKKGKRDD